MLIFCKLISPNSEEIGYMIITFISIDRANTIKCLKIK
jgi:hypothetical protein